MTSRVDDAENRLQQSRANNSAATDRIQDLENRLADLLAEQQRRVHLDGKVSAMDKLVDQREAENRQLQQTNSELRMKLKEYEIEVANAQKSDQKMKELRSQTGRQSTQLEILETELAQKSMQIIEKDKESARDRESIRQLQAQLNDEAQRATVVDLRLRDLEADNAKKCALDGRVKGLENLVEDRARELEKEREESNALRLRVRQMEKSYTAMTRLDETVRELEAQLAMKTDIIQRLENEEARRRGMLDRHRQDHVEAERTLATYHDEIARLKASNMDLQTNMLESQREMQGKLQAVTDALKIKSAEAARAVAEATELRDRHSQEFSTVNRSAERARQAEDETWILKQQLSQMEHEAGTAAVQISDLKRQVLTERSNVAQLTQQLSDVRDRQAGLELATRNRGSDTTAREAVLVVDIKARDDEITRLKFDLHYMKTELGKRTTDASLVSRLQAEVRDLSEQLRRAAIQPLDRDRHIADLERRLREEESRSNDLQLKLRASSVSNVDNGAFERDLRAQVAHLKQQLADVVREDTEKMKRYEGTISRLSEKGTVADEAFDRLKEMTKSIEELRRENTRLRDENGSLLNELTRQRTSQLITTLRTSPAVAPLATLSPHRGAHNS